MDTPHLYKITDLTYRYGSHFTLAVPDLVIDSGSSIGFAGPNGGGKSTLLKLLAFLEAPTEGTIFFEGRKISDSNAAVTRGITILLQEPYLLKRTVFDNVAYGLKVRKQHGDIRSRVCEALELVGLPPEIFSKRLWFELSGGEAQRVALASRLALNPRVLILDEPTASVDHESAFLIKEAIGKFRREYGTSLIVASHDRIWLNSVTDSILKIRNGRIDSFDMENMLVGPWVQSDNALYTKALSDGQSIKSLAAPHKNATGFLKNSDIMIATEHPSQLSAQNILEGTIVQMIADGPESGILVDATIAELSLSSRLTQQGAEALQLIPGKKVWLVFKASSIRWR